MAGDEFDLEIVRGSRSGTYTVHVVRSVAGSEPAAPLRLKVDPMIAQRELLEARVVASPVLARGAGVPKGEDPLRRAGEQLFDALFSDEEVLAAYRASGAVAASHGRPLRLVLRLEADELSVLPWEALYDEERGGYLCLTEPLVRHIPAPTPEPLPVEPPLRVLGLIASPRGLAPLDVDDEQQRLDEALTGPSAAGRISIDWLPQATWHAVHDRLLNGQWHILHFIGHGDYDLATGEGQIALVGPDGRAQWVAASRLVRLLGEADPNPQLVVLNSCSSGESSVSDRFSGTAAALVHNGISAVAAMQFAITDHAALDFARGFYGALAAGRGVDRAVRSGRVEILGTPGTLEWVTPVLYVRGDASQLFRLSPPSAVASGSGTPVGQRGSKRPESNTTAGAGLRPIGRTSPYGEQAGQTVSEQSPRYSAQLIHSSGMVRVFRVELERETHTVELECRYILLDLIRVDGEIVARENPIHVTHKPFKFMLKDGSKVVAADLIYDSRSGKDNIAGLILMANGTTLYAEGTRKT